MDEDQPVNSKDSIHSVFMALRSSLARAVMGMVPPREVEDIVQETYVRVCQVKDWDQIRQPRSYLFRTARNLALDYRKRFETKYTDSIDDEGVEALVDGLNVADGTFEQAASNQEFAIFCEAVPNLVAPSQERGLKLRTVGRAS
jgi:RNA polymerase sigma factor (sigma-70 family)